MAIYPIIYFCSAINHGEVVEWSKALAWKAGRRESVSRVRIPLSPPLENFAVLDGEVAVPYNLQSATAGLNSRPRPD